MSDRPHGYARYKLDRCRCYTCGWAVASYNDAREHSIRRGTWQPFTDAGPARRHVRMLQECGYGTRAIAALAGLDRKAITVLLHGRTDRGTPPPAKIRPATAAALLGVQPSLATLPAKAVVDATGTRRRLQALTAAGWPQAHLAARLGMGPGNYNTLLGQSRVTAGTARAVAALYDQVWRADPRKHGVGAQAYSRARNHARLRDWAPAGAWDDAQLDDPEAVPDTGAPPPRESSAEAAVHRAAEVRHLAEGGASDGEIARRVGLSVRAVHGLLPKGASA